MFRNMKIGFKILLVMLSVSLGSLLVISVISFTQMLNLNRYSDRANTLLGGTASIESENALKKQAEDYLKKLIVGNASYYNESLLAVKSDVLASRDVIEKLYKNPGNYKGYTMPRPDQTKEGELSQKAFFAKTAVTDSAATKEFVLLSNAEIGLASIYAHNPILSNIYLGTKSGISYRYSSRSNFDPNYDPRERGWYKETIGFDHSNANWLDTYNDAYGFICVTCAAPFNGYDGKVQGVVATDITMKTMTDSVLNTKIGEGGYAFILDNHGKYIAHPDYTKDGFEKDPSVGADKEKLAVIESMKRGETGIAQVGFDDERIYVAYAPIESTGWILGMTVPINEIIASAVTTKETINEYSEETSLHIQGILKHVLIRFILLFAICTMLFILIAFVLANQISRPIKELTDSVIEVGSGNLNIHVPVKTTDEVGELAKNFNLMIDSVNKYIEDITNITAEKERIGAELNVATKIQANMLPMIFPPFPDCSEFDIYASMTPAKEVGGDFYDFFMVDDTHIALNISDVSGKGIPAALVMVIGKTLIKMAVQEGRSAGEALAKVNNHFCTNSINDMFITSWLGIVDLKTGIVTCANAGHEYPAIYHKETGKFELMKDKHGLVLGGMENFKYKEYTIELKEGDKLFVYTDGVPEATDADEKLFGNDRMVEALNVKADGNCREVLSTMKAKVDEFVGDAPQFDDLTMLCFELKELKS